MAASQLNAAQSLSIFLNSKQNGQTCCIETFSIHILYNLDIFIEHFVHLIGTILTLVSLLMILISMDCPSRMGVLHANTSGHMLVLDY